MEANVSKCFMKSEGEKGQGMEIIAKDVKFIMSEIKNEEYYQTKVNEYQEMIDTIQKQIELSAMPRSVVTDRLTSGKKSVRDYTSADDFLLRAIAKQQRMEKRKQWWTHCLAVSQFYKNAVLNNSTEYDASMLIDYLSGMPYSAVQRKYCISNFTDHIHRVILKAIKKADDTDYPIL